MQLRQWLKSRYISSKMKTLHTTGKQVCSSPFCTAFPSVQNGSALCIELYSVDLIRFLIKEQLLLFMTNLQVLQEVHKFIILYIFSHIKFKNLWLIWSCSVHLFKKYELFSLWIIFFCVWKNDHHMLCELKVSDHQFRINRYSI